MMKQNRGQRDRRRKCSGPRRLQINGRHLRFRRKPIRLWFAENQKECVNSANRGFCRVIKLRICVAGLAQLVNTLLALRAKVIKPAKHDRFSWTNFRTRGHESAFLSVVTKRALESAAGVGQRLWPAIDHAERTRDDAITTAVANIILHKNRSRFGANNRSRRTRFETTGFFAVLANIGKEHPTEWILSTTVA